MEQLKVGTRVFIRPFTEFWNRESKSNPSNITGSIKSISSRDYCYRVIWDNGIENNYRIDDLLEYKGDYLGSYTKVNINKIYFKDKKPKNLKDILNILYSNNYGSAISTYFKNDKEYILQCSGGKMRSFDDYLLICKTYFPNVKTETAFKNLLLFKMNLPKVDTNICGLRLRACSQIKRINISTSEKPLDSNYNDSLNSNKFDSIYNWKELFKMININSFDDFIQFYKTNLKE